MNYFKSIENVYLDLNYTNLCLLANLLGKKIGEQKIIEGTITDTQFNNIMWDFIILKVYPSLLFENIIMEPDFKNKYVENRTISLEEIYSNTTSLFPSWKIKYNYNIDYNYNYNINPINLRISKNLLKKIFLFYEIIHNFYLDLVIGELFAWILSDYKININPYDINFNKKEFNDWVEKFNKVLSNCRIFFKELYIRYKIYDIDELNKEDLIFIINQIKYEFMINYIKTRENIESLFVPLEKYKLKSNFISFKSSECLNNIEKEINQIFKIKQCYKNIIGSQLFTHNIF